MGLWITFMRTWTFMEPANMDPFSTISTANMNVNYNAVLIGIQAVSYNIANLKCVEGAVHEILLTGYFTSSRFSSI